jgi:hypothetical protein
MPNIFVSFRKVDNRWMRDRIYQALAEAFGANEIFKSGESIPAGGDFGAILRRQAAECKLMLVLIGTAWSDARDAGGERLLDRQDDWVRIEIATALQAGNRVVPVLLGDAAMLPAPVALPDDIAELAQLQFLRVPETHVDDGLQRLITAVSGLLPELAAPAAHAHATAPAGPTAPAGASGTPGAPMLTQNTGGGNAVSVQGGARKARIAGGNIRETKVHTGGIFATATTFLTTKAGIITAAVVVTATGATVAASTSGGGSSNTQSVFAGAGNDIGSGDSVGVGTVTGGPVTNTLRVTGSTSDGPVDATLKPDQVRCGHTSQGNPGIQILGNDTDDSNIGNWEIKWSIPPAFPQGYMTGNVRQDFGYVGVPPGFAWNSRYVSFSRVAVSPTDTTTLTITGKLACTTSQ